MREGSSIRSKLEPTTVRSSNSVEPVIQPSDKRLHTEVGVADPAARDPHKAERELVLKVRLFPREAGR